MEVVFGASGGCGWWLVAKASDCHWLQGKHKAGSHGWKKEREKRKKKNGVLLLLHIFLIFLDTWLIL